MSVRAIHGDMLQVIPQLAAEDSCAMRASVIHRIIYPPQASNAVRGFYEGGGAHSLKAKARNRRSVDHGPLFAETARPSTRNRAP